MKLEGIFFNLTKSRKQKNEFKEKNMQISKHEIYRNFTPGEEDFMDTCCITKI
jgi:hypothetical protein